MQIVKEKLDIDEILEKKINNTSYIIDNIEVIKNLWYESPCKFATDELLSYILILLKK